MSLLNKSDKSSISSTASAVADRLIELFCEKSKIPNCSISNGVFNIYGGDWVHLYLSTDNLELIAGKDSNMSKLAGIKEIRIHTNASITIKNDINFDKNIVIRSQFNVHLINPNKTNVLNVYNLNVDCDRFLLSSRFYLRDSIINTFGICGSHEKCALVNCEVNLKEQD